MCKTEYIKLIIDNENESEYLDFKSIQYNKEKFDNMIIDVMSMANSKYSGDKYIILGVKDMQNGSKDILGISEKEFYDSSIIQNIILNNIEPEIDLDYFPIKYNDLLIGVIEIKSININKPYMLKKDFKNLKEGLCKVRQGSFNRMAKRDDFDRFYKGKETFDIKFMENSLMAVYEKIGCARIKITVRNNTKKSIVIARGRLTIYSKNDEELSVHQVFGFNEYVGADFQLSLFPMEEKLGDIYVGFESSDCLRLNMDEYGCCDDSFIFKLEFKDTYDNIYTSTIEPGNVLAKGKVLWKVKLK